MDLPFAVTTPMRAADTLSPPVFSVPARACDTHFHVFEPGYPAVDEPQYTFPEATIEQYSEAVRSLGIDRMVLVQPTYYGEDNTLTLDALERLGDRARGVVRVEENVSKDTLRAYDRAGVRGIRLDLFARRDWSLSDIRDYVIRMAVLAEPLGWHLQFYAPGTIVHELLPRLTNLPVPFVVDHMGYMKASDGLGRQGLTGLLRAMSAGNCWIKLSGAYRIAAGSPLETTIPLGRRLVSEFPERLIWGSDWPHLPDGQRDTGEVFNLLAAWAPRAADRKSILVTSPDALFFSH